MSPRECDGMDEGVVFACDASAHYTADDGFRFCARHAIRVAGDGGVVTPDEGWPSIDTETPTT